MNKDQADYETRGSYGNSEFPSSVMSINRILTTLSKFPDAKFGILHWQSDVHSFIVIKNEVC